MNSPDSQDAEGEDDQCRAAELNVATARLDVYEHERLAYTDMPAKNTESEPRPTKISAFLKAIYHWVLSR